MELQAACPDVNEVEQDWSRRGFGCDLWTDPPGQSWEDFAEDFDKIIMVLDGRLEVEMNGARSLLKAGDEVLIPCGACHSLRNVGATVSHRLFGFRREDACTD
jgi:quercetin dioxygenase-like cupin family protein